MDVICPLCHHTLSQAEKRWYCDNNHSFDTARQGYTNLLPVQQKKSKSPGDDVAMVTARSQFLMGGYYHPVSGQINQIIIEHLQQQGMAQAAIIDAGCGAGYYSAQLRAALEERNINANIIGIDISKHAVLAAAKRDHSIRWFVANSGAIPVAGRSRINSSGINSSDKSGANSESNGADILLSLFAPVPAEEFHRCLNSNGLLLVASTGKDHLIELRELLYDDVRDSAFDPAAMIGNYFTPTNTLALSFTIDLPDTTTIKNLFAMTPHYWRVSPERKTRLDCLDTLSVTVDIQLHCFQPCFQPG